MLVVGGAADARWLVGAGEAGCGGPGVKRTAVLLLFDVWNMCSGSDRMGGQWLPRALLPRHKARMSAKPR